MNKDSNIIDRRKTYYCIIDTEGFSVDGLKCSPCVGSIYDFGFAIIDKKGRIYHKKGFLIKETLFNRDWNAPHYAKKREVYNVDYVKAEWAAIKWYLQSYCTLYNVRVFISHNSNYDIKAIDATAAAIGETSLLPSNIEFWNSIAMCSSVISQVQYRRYCTDNNYLYHNTPRRTLEILSKFKQGKNYIQTHTALCDVLDLIQILQWIFAQHKKIKKGMIGNETYTKV